MARRLLTIFLLALGLSSPAWAATVNLSWTLSGTVGVTGYRIYVGTATGVYTSNVNAGLSSTGSVGSLTPGTTYYIAVTAYNATGVESVPSNEVVVPITIDPPDPDTPAAQLIMHRVHSR